MIKIRLLILLSLFAHSSHAVELQGADSSVSVFAVVSGQPWGTPYTATTSTESREIDLTGGFGGEWGGEFEGGVGDGSVKKYRVKIYKNGTVVGTYPLEGLDNRESASLVRNARLLNVYISNGAKVNVSANASPREISEAVAKIEKSDNPKNLKARIKILEQEVELKDKVITKTKERYKNCRVEKREDRKRVDANAGGAYAGGAYTGGAYTGTSESSR